MQKESKAEKFVRLAEARTNKVMDMVRLLKNLANRSNYDYTEDQVEKIFTAIRETLDDAEAEFFQKEPPVKRFQLD